MPEVAKKFAEDDPEKDRDLPKYKYGKTTSPEVKKKYDKKKKEEDKDLKKAMSCPVAAKNVKVNTKNRNLAIKSPEIKYGPLNVDNPGDYWEKLADHWDTSESAAKKSLCGNCVAFDISPRMDDCMPGDVSKGGGRLGYCWMHHFKCHSERTCYTWAKGGPISKDKVSHNWQKKADVKKSFVSATALLKKANPSFVDVAVKDQPGKTLRTPGISGKKDTPGFKPKGKIGGFYTGSFNANASKPKQKTSSKSKINWDMPGGMGSEASFPFKGKDATSGRANSLNPKKNKNKNNSRLVDLPKATIKNNSSYRKNKSNRNFKRKLTKKLKVKPIEDRFYGKGDDWNPSNAISVNPRKKPKSASPISFKGKIDTGSGKSSREKQKNFGVVLKGMGEKMKPKAKGEMIVLVSAVDGKGMKKAELEKKRAGGTEAKVLQVLKVEGGAAGMKALKEKINAPDLKDAVDSLIKRGEIFRHEDGDLIKREKKGVMEKQMSSAKTPMMSTPTPTRAGGMGYSGGQMMGKSLGSISDRFHKDGRVIVTEGVSRKIGGPRSK